MHIFKIMMIYMFLTLCLMVALAESTAKPLNIELLGTWQGTSLYSNLIAFVDHANRMNMIENKDNISIKKMVDKMGTLKKKTEKEAFTIFRDDMPKAIQPLLEYGIATHYYSPSIILQQKIADQTLKTCDIEGNPKAFVVHVKQEGAEIELENGKRVSCQLPQLLLDFTKDIYMLSKSTNLEDTVIYGQPGEASFHKFLEKYKNVKIRLFDAAHVGKKERDSFKNTEYNHFERLQGYGVELQIKNLEYKTLDVKDDVKEEASSTISKEEFEKLIENHEDIRDNLKIYKEKMIKKKSDGSYVPLPVRNIGYQVADIILNAAEEDPQKGFEKFEQIAQNFPQLINEILKHNSMNLRNREQAIQNNYRIQHAGRSIIQLNGITFDLEKTTIFTIYDILMKEMTLQQKLNNEGIKNVHSLIYTKPDDSIVPRFNMFHRDGNEKYITYINNVETDHRYKQFKKSVNAVLQPAYYGRRHFARKNMFEALYIIDPATRDGFNRLMHVFQIVNNGYPLRLGLVLTTFEKEEEESSIDLTGSITKEKKITPNMQFLLILTHLFKNKGANGVMQFMHFCRYGVMDSEVMDMNALRNEYKRHAPNNVAFDDLYEKYGPEIEQRMNFLKKAGLGTQPSIVLNGQLVKIDDSDYNELLFGIINKDYDRMRTHIQKRRITDQDNIQEKILELDQAMPQYHPKVFEEPSFSMKAIPKKINWIEKPTSTMKLFSHLVCLNMNHRNAQAFINRMVDHVENHERSRIAFFNHDLKHSSNNRRALLQLLSKKPSVSKLKEALSKDLPIVSEQGEQSNVCASLVDSQLKSDQVLFYSNGRVLIVDIDFDAIHMIEKQEMAFTQTLEDKLKDDTAFNSPKTVDEKSDILLKASALIHENQGEFGFRTETVDHLDKRAALQFAGSQNLPRLVAHLNPISQTGQHWISIIHKLATHFDLPTMVFLNPEREYKNIPMKSYYRTVFTPSLIFENGKRVRPVAHFSELPPTHILTTNMKVPETWLIESTYSIPDTDNLNIGSFSEDSISIRYQLENIVITGSCYETPSQVTQRGLQFYLGNAMNDHLQDTLVMSNYGYYQLKANPGVFSLTLAPGRSTEVFSLDSYSATSFYSQRASNFIPGPVNIPIRHFDGPFIHLKVRKNPGFEKEELLKPSSEESSIWKNIKNAFGSKDKDGVVHIFTIASGHLYERLMRIMMKSVLTHTKSKVKFWIIKNYLSPQYKEILPEMAKKYGFEYGLVTYKWPTWLNKQTEKQRLIWAYKILFLDVLFPLDVHRIIYVDADQVTRADMTELYTMNIQNKAVAYTPFCSSRPEMDGYAFWKQGYWRNHLRGRPYHISALYLVDIDQLRRTYAGDRYRMIYDNLSKDPNSLSNLDQDLPNYAQHNVPIFSLPQEWLWCETWCSQGSKSAAKTIDLCNNPETKEHKVASAIRIVPEWTTYDNEVNKEFVNNELGIDI